MRKSTLLWLLLAAVCGASLYHTSQRVHDGREKVAQLEHSIAREDESIHVLQAEWSYLNQPARLEKLVHAHLAMAALAGKQFAKAEDIPLRGTTPLVKFAVMPALRGHLEARLRVLSNQHDGQTAFQTPAQGGGDTAPKTISHNQSARTASRSMSDVFKSLGVNP